jgi:hypothetical protein
MYYFVWQQTILQCFHFTAGVFISPSGISDPCGTVAGMVDGPKISVEILTVTALINQNIRGLTLNF